jgi:hypothetical protein
MMTNASKTKHDLVLMGMPHLAFVIECLGLASLARNTPHKEILTRLGRCLERLAASYGTSSRSRETPTAALALWLDEATKEFHCLTDKDFPALLDACTGNTMPEWLKDMARTELGDSITDLITQCMDC